MASLYQYKVRQLLYELGLYVNDAILVRASATAGDNLHFVTSDLAGQTVNSLVASELFPWDGPAAGATISPIFPPFLVTANDAAGLLTLNRAMFANPIPVNARAVLQNINGRGYPQVKKEFALKMACMDLGRVGYTAYITIASPSTTDFWNGIDLALRSVYRVAGYRSADNYEYEISPATWQDRLDVAGRRINIPFDWQSGDTLRLYGRIDQETWWEGLYPDVYPATPASLLASYQVVVPGDSRKIIQAAVPWLLDGKRDDKAAEMVQFAYARSQREMRERSLPNEVWLE